MSTASLAAHELGHVIAAARDSVLTRIDPLTWEVTQPEPLTGAAVVKAQLGGIVAERVYELGLLAALDMLDDNPRAFFDTHHASPEDLVLPAVDPETCAAIAAKIAPIIAEVLSDIGSKRLEAIAARMRAMDVGDSFALNFGVTAQS